VQVEVTAPLRGEHESTLPIRWLTFERFERDRLQRHRAPARLCLRALHDRHVLDVVLREIHRAHPFRRRREVIVIQRRASNGRGRLRAARTRQRGLSLCAARFFRPVLYVHAPAARVSSPRRSLRGAIQSRADLRA
jgi:hypothetical protein